MHIHKKAAFSFPVFITPPSKNDAKSSGKNRNKNKKQSNTHNINQKASMPTNTTTSAIAEMAERKQQQSDEQDNEFFTSEHFLNLNRKILSKSLFTNIAGISENDIIPLKHKIMKNPRNKKLKDNIINNLRKTEYRKWLIELKTGFNLLFHGVGSKKYILEDFARIYCCHDPDGIVIRVNGFDDAINVKQIVESVAKDIIDKDKKNKTKQNRIKTCHNIEQRAKKIVEYFENKNNRNNLLYEYIYLIIHNIDGKSLRKIKSQTTLSILGNCKYIHLIASVDHQHFGSLWNRNHLNKFHWIYHEITTYKHYFEEMEFSKEQIIEPSKERKSHGLKHIMNSLTPQHCDIIQILAEYQIKMKMGLEEDEWYTLCGAKLIVSNDLNFKQYINEFIDHKIIIEDVKRGVTSYSIPYDDQIIEKHFIH